jgi:hypothetical protein
MTGPNFFNYGSSDFAEEMVGLAGFRERVDKGSPGDLARDTPDSGQIRASPPST